MATWKKVIVSGSTANLASLQVDDLTNGYVVIGGGGSNLTARAVSGSGAILASGGSGIVLSGSFSGSFTGDGSGLTGVVATNPNGLTNGEGISAFSYNGLTAQTVAISGAVDLTNNVIIKWDNNANKVAVSSMTDNGTIVSGTTSLQFSGANTQLTGSFTGSHIGVFSGSFSGSITSVVVSSSFASTASLAYTASRLVNALTIGNGLTGTSYDGSSPVTVAVGAGALIGVSAGTTAVNTSSLTTNQLPKYSGNALAGSNVSDNGTTITLAGTTTNVTSTNFQVGTNKLTVDSGTGNTVIAGTLSVTGNTSITGDLTVQGTASFQNTQNLLVADKFILLASGSSNLTDGGIIVSNGGGGAAGYSGSAWYLETTSAGSYGRWATAYQLHASASTAVADEYAVTAKINQASNPTVDPTWGGSTSGTGNMWITNAGDIFIYA